MKTFLQWLEYNDLGGQVYAYAMNNTAAEDGMSKVRSKWMTGHKPERTKEFDPDKIFGFKKNKMKAK